MLTKDELLTILDNWVNIEDDKEVVNVTIDEEIDRGLRLRQLRMKF